VKSVTLIARHKPVIFIKHRPPKGDIVNRPAAAALAVLLLLPAIISPSMGQSEEAPEGVQILLPRGGIPAIFEPTFVSADAAEIPDDAWILGIVIDGEAHAYSLNLLNSHEVVNDHVGDVPVAAVW
jgi:hypothetical protein